MCWNAEVSLSTFILGCAAIVIGQLNKLHDVKWSLFYFTIASMQLLEFFIWRYGMNNKDLNRWLSYLGLMIILLQPLAAGFLIKDMWAKKAYFLAYAGFCLVYIWWHWPIRFETAVAGNKHLAWRWLATSWPFILLWTVFIIVAISLSGISWFNVCIIAGFIVALTVWSYVSHIRYPGAWGSVYCSFMNIIFVLILIKAFSKQYCGLSKN